MRLLSVVHGFPPHAQGGSELYAESLANALSDRHGHDVLVLTREQDASRPECAVRRETRGSLQIAWVNNTFARARSFEDTYLNMEIGAAAERLIDEHRPELAHVHHLTCLSTSIVPVLASRRVPVVLTLHDYWMMCHRGQLLDVDLEPCAQPGSDGCGRCAGPAGTLGLGAHTAASALRRIEPHLPGAVRGSLRRVAGRAAHLVAGDTGTTSAEGRRAAHMLDVCAAVTTFLAPSRHIAGVFEAFGVPGGRIRHWPYGVEAARRPGAREPLDGRPLRVAFVGSLMVSKAPHLLLDALAGMPAGRVEAHVLGEFVPYHGDDSYRGIIEPLLAQPGVRAYGRLTRQEAADVVASMDAVVVPSVWPENSPLVIHEALAAGVPVVASNIGGIPELVRHEYNGLLVRPGDVDDLRAALERLAADPGLVVSLARRARRLRTLEDDAEALHWFAERLVAPARQQAQPRTRPSAVVLNYQTPGETTLAVRSLLASRTRLGDVIVADNAATGECARELASLGPRVRVIELSSNLGFSGGMNAGIRVALDRGASCVLLVNSDVVVRPDCLAELEAVLDASPSAGIAAPVVLSRAAPDEVATVGMSYDARSGRMRHAGAGRALASLEPLPTVQTVDAVSGCVMLVRREVFESVGLLDESFFFSFEDLEFCVRARRAGYASIIAGRARAWHEGGRTMGLSPRRLYFAARNHLLAARRASPESGRVATTGRAAAVVAYNLAHAVRARGGSAPARVAAVLRGTVDYARGRFGPGPAGP